MLGDTVVWDSGDRPVLAVGGTSVFLSRNKFDSEGRKSLFFNVR